MASLGFRPPQFSDDVAWLPAWIQPHVEGMDEEEEEERLSDDECRGTWDRELKDTTQLEGKSRRNEDPNIFSNKGNGWYCDHLLLSGDSNSAACCSSISSRKMCQFDLHLSTDGISSAISSLLMDISQAERVKLSPPVQLANSSVGLIEARLSNIDHGLVNLGLSHSTLKCRTTENLASATFNSTASAEQRKEQNISKEDSHDTEIDDAVELSVSASEALVIHELLQSESYTEVVAGTAIVEIALRLKLARVERLYNSCSTEETDSSDVLSDLDDCFMKDAYADVGLSIDPHCHTFGIDSTNSHVKGSPDRHSLPENDMNNEGEQKPTKDLVVNADREKQKTECSKPALDFISVPEIHDNHHINYLHPGKFGDLTFPQEGDTSTGLRCQNPKSLPKALVVVTSYLSESAMGASDENPAHIECSSVQKPLVGPAWILPESSTGPGDENSFVKDHDNCSEAPDSKMVFADLSRMNNREQLAGESSRLLNHHMLLSASGSHSEGPWRTDTGWPLICSKGSEESSLSDIDPLCSIVPCSIGTQNKPLSESKMDPVLNSKEVKEEDSKYEAGNTPIVFHASGAVDGEDLANIVTSMDAQPVSHRHLSSLKVYSTGFPSEKPCLEMESPHVDLVNHEKHNSIVLFHEKPFGQTNLSSKDQVKQPSMRSHFDFLLSEKGEEFSTFIAENALTVMNGHMNPLVTSAAPDVQIAAPMEDIQPTPLVEPDRKTRQLQDPQLPFADNCNGDQEVNLDVVSVKKFTRRALLVNPHLQHIMGADTPVPRKRVRVSEVDVSRKKQRTFVGIPVARASGSIAKKRKGREPLNQNQCLGSQELKDLLRNYHNKGKKTRLIFQGLEFLLTGFSKLKQKEIEGLLGIHGGIVLSDIPSINPRQTAFVGSDSHQLPVILSTKELQTTRFLYGCAVNAFILRVRWVTDSIEAGSVLPPDKYMILANLVSRKRYRIGKSACKDGYIFDKVGIMLIGSDSFCSKMDRVIKHGRGCIFKSLQWMLRSSERKKISLGVIVAENQTSVSRHLRTCATELEIPILPAAWIISSLYEGKLLPIKDKAVQNVADKVPEPSAFDDWSQEI